MRVGIRHAVLALGAITMAVALAACGPGGADPDVGSAPRIGLLLPDATTASPGAAMAVTAARGHALDRVAKVTVRPSGGKQVPAVMLTPVSVTVGNIKDTLVKDRVYTVGQICVPRPASACSKAGLT